MKIKILIPVYNDWRSVPVTNEVINIRPIGRIFMNIKKSNFLSFILILNLIFLTNK